MVVEGERDGVRRERVGGPEREGEAVGDLDGRPRPDRVGQAGGVGGVEPDGPQAVGAA